MASRTGGQLLVESLEAHGVTTAFGVPGESYLAVLDALHDSSIRYVSCRQEGGAAYMAEAWGKLTGSAGVCMVTRGPGATNASVGVHTAMQDSTPMVLLVGQVAVEQQGREAFQEVDYRAFFGPLAKWATEITDVHDISEIMVEAFHTAMSGRPGPVVIALPEDLLAASTEVPVLMPRLADAQPPSSAEVDEIIARLTTARRPVIIVGGGRWTENGRRELLAFAELNTIPVVAAFRFHDLIDNHSDMYVGEAGVAMPSAVRETVSDADLIVGLGIRFGEMTTAAWTLLDVPRPRQSVIHVHPGAAEIGKLYDVDLGIVADPASTITALGQRHVDSDAQRTEWATARRTAFLESTICPSQPGPVDMGIVMSWLQQHLPADAILTNGAGNFTVWPNKFFRYGPEARLLAPQSGSMGYGLPAAIAAKAAHPDRMALCFTGDGDLQMTMQELGSAAQAELQPIVLLLDNSMYGTIRMHQERNFPGRVVGTDLVNPDFVAIAQAYGFHAERVDRTDAFPAAFRRAQDSPTGALLHIPIDPSMLTPRESIADARARAQASPR